jgi:archaemetzincin
MIGVYQQESLNFFSVVEDVVKKYLNQSSHDAGAFRLPPNAYNPLRQQYDAMSILAYIADRKSTDVDLGIGLVAVDIYSHGTNFIFGLADPLKRTAIVSLYHLAGEKMKERTSKEVIHEIGHLVGLRHCANQECIMHFSNTINDTDKKNISFCKACGSKIE